MEPSASRLSRAVKMFRRVFKFKAAGGGILVAADIVIPDPQIIKIASIWGGVDMVLDAVGGA